MKCLIFIFDETFQLCINFSNQNKYKGIGSMGEQNTKDNYRGKMMTKSRNSGIVL